MEIIFKELDLKTDVKELAALASKIWNEYYPEVISQKQIDYMLEQSYSAESLRKQLLEDKHVFTGAFIDDKMAGYISVSDHGNGEYFINKLYIDTAIHRKGTGRVLFEHFFKNKKFRSIRLTVNRQNFKAINFYFKIGFVIEKVIDIEIGNGFVMNDFVMIKNSGDIK